ncbi:flagellar attachment zone protein 1-like isoform X2 [Oscarella lobularis]|uniref:flagellar attachment zone protein 1-like isoform X2 n=1 Tax=Oscarella lobularis TaxID=121494 RepID=UPI003313BD8B
MSSNKALAKMPGIAQRVQAADTERKTADGTAANEKHQESDAGSTSTDQNVDAKHAAGAEAVAGSLRADENSESEHADSSSTDDWVDVCNDSGSTSVQQPSKTLSHTVVLLSGFVTRATDLILSHWVFHIGTLCKSLKSSENCFKENPKEFLKINEGLEKLVGLLLEVRGEWETFHCVQGDDRKSDISQTVANLMAEMHQKSEKKVNKIAELLGDLSGFPVFMRHDLDEQIAHLTSLVEQRQAKRPDLKSVHGAIDTAKDQADNVETNASVLRQISEERISDLEKIISDHEKTRLNQAESFKTSVSVLDQMVHQKEIIGDLQRSLADSRKEKEELLALRSGIVEELRSSLLHLVSDTTAKLGSACHEQTEKAFSDLKKQIHENVQHQLTKGAGKEKQELEKTLAETKVKLEQSEEDRAKLKKNVHDADDAKSHTREENEKLTATLAEKEEELRRCKDTVSNTRKENEKLTATLAEKKEELRRREDTVSNTRKENEKLTATLAEKEEELRRCEDTVSNSRKENEKLTATLAEKKEELRRCEDTVSNTRKENEKLTATLAEKKEELRRREDTVSNTRKENEKLTATLAEKKEELRRCEDTVSNTRKENEKLTAALAEKEEELRRCEDTVSNTRKENEKLTATLAEKKEELRRCEDTVSNTRKENEKLTATLAEKKEELRRREDTVSNTRKENEKLTATLAEKEEELRRCEDTVSNSRKENEKLTATLAEKKEELRWSEENRTSLEKKVSAYSEKERVMESSIRDLRVKLSEAETSHKQKEKSSRLECTKLSGKNQELNRCLTETKKKTDDLQLKVDELKIDETQHKFSLKQQEKELEGMKCQLSEKQTSLEVEKASVKKLASRVDELTNQLSQKERRYEELQIKSETSLTEARKRCTSLEAQIQKLTKDCLLARARYVDLLRVCEPQNSYFRGQLGVSFETSEEKNKYQFIAKGVVKELSLEGAGIVMNPQPNDRLDFVVHFAKSGTGRAVNLDPAKRTAFRKCCTYSAKTWQK